MSGDFGYRFCARCGKNLMRDQEGSNCISCGWRPPTAGDAKSALETMSTADLEEHWRAQMAVLDRRVRVHQQEIADLLDEKKKFEKLIAAITSSAGKAKRQGPRAVAVAPGERWTCLCGWQAAGRSPGRHTSTCEVYQASKEGAA